MKLTILIAYLFLVTLMGVEEASAQKVYRIGALVAEDFFLPTFEGFKAKMAELGYVERKNVQYELRNAKGSQEALRKLAQKLVQDKPDLIVTSSTAATLPVAKASEGTHIPVVFLGAANPLEFVKSYASSGNNLTGISTAVLDLTAKRMELLKELAPRVKRVASLNNPKGLIYKDNLVAVREAAKKLGLELREINVTDRKEIEQVSPTLTRKVVDAVFLPPDRLLTGNIEVLVKQSIKEKLPLIPPPPAFKIGGLATYGHDYYSLGQQGAVLVDKVLKGAKPSDLPIEQPLKLKLMINLKTAKAIGLKVPREILLRADEVIE
ncbi:MAG: ABC transporter substrate-binding protein [Candidatus Binatota bacterium]